MEKGKAEGKPKFAIIGLGFISETHMDAIEEVGGEIIIACDIDEQKWYKIGRGCFPYMHWKVMMKDDLFDQVTHVSICTPNYLHYEMIMAARELGKVVICEKPLVIIPSQALEFDDGVNCVLQLRYSPILGEICAATKDEANEVEMDISVHRGGWYFETWKNKPEQSGGLALNIGIHYFDLLQRVFGNLSVEDVWIEEPDKCIRGVLTNNSVFINWKLSLLASQDTQRRMLIVNGKRFNLTRRFNNLHTKVYEKVLAGKGIKGKDVFTSLNLVNQINRCL